MTETEDIKVYPIGKANLQEFTKDVLYRSIIMVEAAPQRLRKVLENIGEQDLERSYREGGWTIRQIVHHLADSHMNMLVRFKLALTEQNPVIKPYQQALWAELPDYRLPVEGSLALFEAIQFRFSELLKVMSEADFGRSYVHPEYKKTYTLAEATQLYAWHGLHHTAQIEGIIR